MNPVLIDSSFIVALIDDSEQHHEKCAEVLNGVDGPLVTCEPVIAECCHLLRKVHGAARSVVQNIEQGVIQIPYCLAERAEKVTALLAKYADIPMDLADACLVDLADKLQTGRILTLDSDFRIYRWARNRPFEIIPTK